MARTIDGTARRLLLAQAVWRIVLRDGLGAASVRTVAAESGLSAGSVRHFFGSQRELIEFSMRELVAAVGERIATAAQIDDPQARAIAVLEQIVPLTEATRAEGFAHMQFVTAARFDAALAPIAQESFAAIRDVCRQAVVWLVEAGRLPPGAPLDDLADELWALVDGLTFRLLLAPGLVTVDEARARLRAFVQDMDGRDQS